MISSRRIDGRRLAPEPVHRPRDIDPAAAWLQLRHAAAQLPVRRQRFGVETLVDTGIERNGHDTGHRALLSAFTIFSIPFNNASGLKDILSIPSLTRNRANSG